MQKVIIIGATSGIGRELARMYAGAGNFVGVTGRRHDLLYSLQLEYPNNIVTECFDITEYNHIAYLEALIKKLGGMDLFIYNSGYGQASESLDWHIDKKTVDINVNGFISTINYAFNYFVQQGQGQIVTTSSIASIRGSSRAPAYSASKAFQSVYFEGLSIKARKLDIPLFVTDIQPGFVKTGMTKREGLFWVAPLPKAARQIFRAIERKKRRVYITRRWWLIAGLMKWMPEFIYKRIG